MGRFSFFSASAAAAAFLSAGGAMAAPAPIAGRPVDGAIDLQGAATEAALTVHHFNNFILPIIIAISVLVLGLLIWVIVRFNRRAHPTPKTFTHNVFVEIVWTVAPVLILVAIAAQSFPMLYQQERTPPTEITIKAIGNSWFWQYEYPDYNVLVASNMLPEDDPQISEERPYRLAVDQPIYVPVNTNVRIEVTSNDVIHSWTVPSFGVKQDAIPGRLNQGWFNVMQEGTYFGQCSELCGVNHAFMPIEVRAVSRAEFDRWIVSQGGSLAQAEEPAPAPAPAETPAPAAAPAAAPAR
ncbi:MAG: cytochrome c oxidase subunit II [Alphaproteobacteria bacterium]|nr:cytochrome c oxidase subunit II [Alphaproteobacteria bacterium]